MRRRKTARRGARGAWPCAALAAFAAAAAAFAPGPTARAAEESSTVRIEVLSLPAQVYVEGFCAGVAPCTARVRKGDRIRVVDERGPEHGLTYTFSCARKSHISGYERSQFSLVYLYAGEKELRFERVGNAWYRVDGGEKVLVGVDATGRSGKGIGLAQAAGKGAPYLWVKIEAEGAAGTAEALKAVPRLGLQMRHVTDASLAAVGGLKNLEALCLSGPNEDHDADHHTVRSIAPLAGLAGLRKLNLDGCKLVTDLSPVAKLTGLTGLGLEQCAGLADLSALSGLKELHALGLPPQTTDAQLAGIARDHPGLTHLNLEYCRAVSDLAPLARLASLEAVNLESSGVKDLAPLAGLKALHTVGLPPSNADAALARVSRDHPGLAVLSLGFTDAGNLAPLAGMKSLRWLYLGKQLNKGGRDYAPVAGLEGLAALNLNGCRVADLKFLEKLTSLRALVLRQTHSIGDLSPLANLTEIEYLSTRYGKEVADLSPLAGLTKLRNLQIRMSTASDLSPLADMKELLHLDLTECKNVKDLTPLHALKKLRYVGTPGRHLKPQAEALRKAVPGCSVK